MKQPSDMPTPRFEHGGGDLWSNTLLLDHGGGPILPCGLLTILNVSVNNSGV